MENFIKELNLERSTQDKLASIKPVLFGNTANKKVKLFVDTNDKLFEDDLAHFIGSIIDVKNRLKIPMSLSNIFIDQLTGVLNASEIYAYVIKLIPLFDKEVVFSHFYVELDHEHTKLIVTNERTFDKLNQLAGRIEPILKNATIITKPMNVEFRILKEKVDVAQESIQLREEKLAGKEDLAPVRDGFTLVDYKLEEEQFNVYFEGEVVDFNDRNVKTKMGPKVIRSFIVGKGTEAVAAIHWGTEDEGPKLKDGIFIRVYGNWKYDGYRKEFRISIDGNGSWQYLNKSDLFEPVLDDYPEKRSELHVHTKMSYMDGVGSVEDYVERARSIGLKSIAITDHDSVQAYPDLANYFRNNNIDDLKLIYGVELSILDDINNKIVWNPKGQSLQDSEYVFFDLETTGISPLMNKLIEFGGVKYKDGMVVETFQTFINPNENISEFITSITNISDEDVKDAPNTSDALKKIKDWIGDAILVAHNAKFDYNFLNANLIKYGYGELQNTVIDTMGIARIIHPRIKNHQLGTVAKAEFVIYNEMEAHRADYDALILQKTYENLLHKLLDRNIRTTDDFVAREKEVLNFLFPNHVTVYAKNSAGIKQIYELISLAHTMYFAKERSRAVLPLSVLLSKRDNIIIGSACSEGFVWNATNDQTANVDDIYKMFDFIEVFPPSVYKNLVNRNMFTPSQIAIIIKNIIDRAKLNDVPVVATSNAHYPAESDKIIRDVYIHNKGLKGRRHPLFNWKNKMAVAPDHHLRTTSEMMEEFESFLSPELSKEIVITNSNMIADSIEDGITPIKTKLYTPTIPGAEDKFLSMIDENLKRYYGTDVNPIITDRIKREVDSIMKHGFSIVYYLSALTVTKSLEDGFLVGSRGSVGSSLAATMTNITEVNPMPAHYRCETCKHHEFVEGYSSGYDLPNKNCPVCGNKMTGDGHNIPFETFLGFDGDKVPDIDLNFSRDYQAQIHKYVKDILGERNVFRAGTISTVANRTAFGYIKNYMEETEQTEEFNQSQIKYLAKRVEGTKRTNGQHPGGLIVVPSDMDIYDFTPINYPGNDLNSEWKTTHFDFHSIHDNLLKLDLLGHLDPSSIRMLESLTGVSPFDIPMNDPMVLELFETHKPLNYVQNHTGDDSGIIGIPEFGTSFVRRLVSEAKPKSFADLVRLSGLSHGTDVWTGNARDLIIHEGKTLEEIISTRDDIMSYLIEKGMNNLLAFQIMESVRKGKGLSAEWERSMKEASVPEWYITSCKKIKYMFPKAHATAYVLMAFRIAWYKINYPLEYYATFFTKRDTEWDIDTLNSGVQAIKKYRKGVSDLGWSASEREKNISETYEIVLEMLSRGYTIGKISVQDSAASSWTLDKENNRLIPPFTIIEGLGEAVATKIIIERDRSDYRSKEDFKARSSLNQTLYNKLDDLGVLDTLGNNEETGQISLF